mmetsp:Transcript_20298/g.61160  ORF Transcript_20298/g.61160 Transcript_20298/m.61160 type:complete len:108 (+) Transcript_20298:151-474(+)
MQRAFLLRKPHSEVFLSKVVRSKTSQSHLPSGQTEGTESAAGNTTQKLLKPTEPGPEDCCQGGCRECVWDIYWRELKVYEAEKALQEGKAPPLDPFEELERRLAGKS